MFRLNNHHQGAHSIILHCARYTHTTGRNKVCSHSTENFITDTYTMKSNRDFGEAQTVSSLIMVYVNPETRWSNYCSFKSF